MSLKRKTPAAKPARETKPGVDRSNREISEVSQKFKRARLLRTKNNPSAAAAATERPKPVRLHHKEKQLLFEKDHVTPQFNDVEKKLIRIATKGVVTLFNAVREQQKAIEQIQHNSSLLLSEKERLTKQQTHSGFIDLLESSSKGQLTKKLSDLQQSDDEDDDSLVKSEDEGDAKSEDDSDGTENTMQQLKKPAKQWSVLEDNYLKQSSNSMKNWEQDSDSDSDSDDII